jgi:universal stress protein A
MTPDFKRIVVPVDFSSNSTRAVEHAHMLATRFGASLHLLHVCEVPSLATGSMDAYAIAYSNWSQQLGDEAERQLLKLQATLTGVAVSTEVLFGNAARAIVTNAINRKADLIVMGTHGHGPLMHAWMGNVAERVVRTAPCPVLTVREPREASAGERTTAAGVAAAGILAAIP